MNRARDVVGTGGGVLSMYRKPRNFAATKGRSQAKSIENPNLVETIR